MASKPIGPRGEQDLHEVGDEKLPGPAAGFVPVALRRSLSPTTKPAETHAARVTGFGDQAGIQHAARGLDHGEDAQIVSPTSPSDS